MYRSTDSDLTSTRDESLGTASFKHLTMRQLTHVCRFEPIGARRVNNWLPPPFRGPEVLVQYFYGLTSAHILPYDIE